MTAMKAAKRIWHHDTNTCGNFERIENEVKTLMNKVVLEDSADTFDLVDEFRNRYKGEEKKHVKQSLQAEIHDEIDKADKERMRDTITSHSRDCGLVRGDDSSKKGRV